MDQGFSTEDCGVLGEIKKEKIFKNSNGECAFKPTELEEVTDIGGCPTITEGERDGEYMLFFFGEGNNQSLDDPEYYNADDPRHGLRTNK